MARPFQVCKIQVPMAVGLRSPSPGWLSAEGCSLLREATHTPHVTSSIFSPARASWVLLML